MKKIILISCSFVTLLLSNDTINYMYDIKYKNYIEGIKYKNENNINSAENKFLIACEQDNIKQSCYEAGMLLENKNKLQSIKLLKKGCDLNDKASCIKLANIYLIGKQNGGIVDKNEELADKYYQKGIN